MVNSTCNKCGKSFTLKKDLTTHLNLEHGITRPFGCSLCPAEFGRNDNLKYHVNTQHRRQDSSGDIVTAKRTRRNELQPRLIHYKYNGSYMVHRLDLPENCSDILSSAKVLRPMLDDLTKNSAGTKVQLRATVKFIKALDETTSVTASFASKQMMVLREGISDEVFDPLVKRLDEVIERFQAAGSGWVVDRVNFIDIYTCRYRPITATSYIETPKALCGKHAIINVKNKDDRCFMWSVLAALYPVAKHPQRVSKYKDYTGKLDFTGISFPVALTDVKQFEALNGLSVNVFGYGEGLYPLRLTDQRDREVINLLYLEADDGRSHYCFIKDLSRLLFRERKHEGRKHVCSWCLCPFNNAARLDKHKEFCRGGCQRIEMPNNEHLKFKHVSRILRVNYVIYADFECYNKPQDDGRQLHEPNSYGMIGIRKCCSHTTYETPITYRGVGPARHFLDKVVAYAQTYQAEPMKAIIISPQEADAFKSATKCHICEKELGNLRVRDHCHRCGKYRGPAHDHCNKLLSESRDISVLFHNLRKYDGHLLMQEIGEIAQKKGLTIECVPRGLEDYITFSLKSKTNGKTWRIRFLDSYAFLNASLDNLAASLPTEKLKALAQFMTHPELLVRKGFYPYESVTGPAYFTKTGIPLPKEFYNSLKKESISPSNWQHAKNVWEKFNCQNFGDYHDIYLMTDVLLLADIFEAFRDFCQKHYGLDPVHYATLPSFAWDALLKTTGVELELLQDPDMYHFFVSGIRGGISVISHRYAKANNPYIENYNPSEPTSFITYLDANNLYGWAMQQKLPVGGFDWLSDEEVLKLEADMKAEVSHDGYGYILDVDLNYPKQLHERHNNYPLAPEKMSIIEVSPYCKMLRKKLEIKECPVEKLVPNLNDKEHYIVHHQNLRFYLKQGMVLKKIHRGIRFKEAAWMAPYISFNTDMRRKATTQFEKDHFKLLNNAVFGKSMENVFAYADIRLVTNQTQFEKLVASPRYKESQPIKNDLVAVSMLPEKITLSKPIYTGFCVLELSKILMYDFHYNYMTAKYGDKLKLLFTDTDSLCYYVETEDVYKDMLADRDNHFDTSDYPCEHELHSNLNKKKIGLMKDETNGTPIQEFVGLRSKMYSIKSADEDKKRAKGIAKAVVKKEITHEDYRTTLFGETKMKHEMKTFRSKQHEVYTVTANKISLSAYDDKRYIMEDGITSYAYGHRAIPDSPQSRQPSECLTNERCPEYLPATND